MNNSRQIWVWVGVAVVVVAVAAAFIWKPAPTTQPPTATSTSPAPVYAPQGQLVPEFPKDLIIDDTAAISGSYSIGYSSTTNQYTAQFNSSSTVTALYNQYKTYLAAHNWTITGSLTTRPTFDAISASQGSSTLQVVISKMSKGSQVTITYVVK